MSDFTLEASFERARRAALAGDPVAFDTELQAIRTLDRYGTAPMRELRMLELVVRARQADLAAVDGLLSSLEPLAPSDWRQLHGWLIGAPEMEHATYAEFVRSLDRRRRQARMPAARRLTPMLIIALVSSVTALLLLAWRVTPLPATETNRQAIESVLSGRWSDALAALPGAWSDRIGQTCSALAAKASPDMATRTIASVDALSKALEAAADSPLAPSLARQLVGPLGSAEDLRRLARGVQAWRESPWLSVAAWGDGRAASWSPQGEALFAWRTLLRHAPLTAWLPGWFGGDHRVDPLVDSAVSVRDVAREQDACILQVQLGATSWSLTTRRVGRHWVPAGMVDRWSLWQSTLDPATCDAAKTRLAEERLIMGLDAVTAWVNSWIQSSGTPAPALTELPWWVP